MTVQELLDYVRDNNVPMDAELFYERVEDRYFNGVDTSGMSGRLPDGSLGILPEGSKSNGWSVVRKKGYRHYCALQWNLNLQGKFTDRKNFPDFDLDNARPHTAEELEEAMEQYITVESACTYQGSRRLYLTAHY